jgi:hypothetical protein
MSAAATDPSPEPRLAIRRGLLPGDLVEEAAQTLRAMAAAQLDGAAAGDLDTAIDALRARDRTALGAVYDGFRESLAFRQIVTHPALTEAAATLVGAARLHSPFQHTAFRMDMAGEHWRGFAWHQDYPYNMLSDRYVTAWLPLTAVGPDNGSIEVAPAWSDRIHPVEIRFKRDAEGRRLSTRDAFIAGRLQAQFAEGAQVLSLAPGDVVLFDGRLVHRSGFNPGPRHRYSIQARFGDLMAPEMIARAWANRRVDGFSTFKAAHPELVEFEEI